MIGSFSMSCCNCLTTLILYHLEMPVEYKLMTCLPKAFPVFSPFLFGSRCLYSAYVLSIISSLTLSALLCVHLHSLTLSTAFFNSSCYLCCSIPSLGVSTTYQKTMSPTSVIIFIKCRNRNHMKNNIRYKGNTSNTSVIIYFF